MEFSQQLFLSDLHTFLTPTRPAIHSL